MSNPGILEAWHRLLPPDVAISAGPLLADAAELTTREERSAGTMDRDRTLEFRTGRTYAKLALSKLGWHAAELPVGTDRAPVWPAGVSGSITHAVGISGGHVAAAVAKTEAVGAIGIDAEANRPLHPGIWKQFLAGSELQKLSELSVESRATIALTIWCVKEATAKALGKAIAPTNISVCHQRAVSDAYDVWSSTVQCSQSAPVRLMARTARLPELIIAGVVLGKHCEARQS